MSAFEPSYAYNEDRMMAGIRAFQEEQRQLLAVAKLSKPAAEPAMLPDPYAMPAPPRFALAHQRLKWVRPRTAPYGIIDEVAAHFGLSRKEILLRTNTPSVVRPRYVAMYILRKHTILSLPGISRLFHKHHTTTLYGIRLIETLIATDAALAAAVRVLLGETSSPQYESASGPQPEGFFIESHKTLVHVIAAYFGFTPEQLMRRDNSTVVSRARQIAMLAVRSSTMLSLTQIGRVFGRHHSAVIDACRQAKVVLATNPALAAALDPVLHYAPLALGGRKLPQSVAVPAAAESRAA